MERIIKLRNTYLREQNAAIQRNKAQQGLTPHDIHDLCETAIMAWAKAPGDVYEVIFTWRKTQYRSQLSFLYVRIMSMDFEPVAATFTPDAWPYVVGKRQARTQRNISRSQRFAILKRDNYRCQLCGMAAHDGKHVRLEVDHIIAVAQGGSNHNDNLWTLCFACNRGKSDHEP